MADENTVGPHLEIQHQCRCGKSYRTKAGLQQHQRRYCRRSASDVPDGLCQICKRKFSTYAGMRQHMRLAHPIEYNLDLEKKATTGRRHVQHAWTDEEIMEAAREEVWYRGRDINLRLSRVMGRTQEAIKSLRNLAGYKNAFIEAMEENRILRLSPPEHSTSIEIIEHLNVQETVTASRSSISGADSPLLRPKRRPIPMVEVQSPSPPRRPSPEPRFTTFLNDNYGPQMDVHDTHLVEALDNPFDNGQAAIETYLKHLYSILNKNKPRAVKGKGKPESKTGKAKRERTLNRQQLFRRAQQLFNRNRKKLIQEILEGEDPQGGDRTPTKEVIATFYGETFGTQSLDDEGSIAEPKERPVSLDHTITIEEIKWATLNGKNGAPGPDGIKGTELGNLPTIKLLLLYNAMLENSCIPYALKESRTTLISKGLKSEDINNWRPISLQSTILRFFNKIIAKRLSALKINP